MTVALASRAPAEALTVLRHFDAVLDLVGGGDAARGSQRLGMAGDIASLVATLVPLIDRAFPGGHSATARAAVAHLDDVHGAAAHLDAGQAVVGEAIAASGGIIAAAHSALEQRGAVLLAEITALGPQLLTPWGMAQATSAVARALDDAARIVHQHQEALQAGPVAALHQLLSGNPAVEPSGDVPSLPGAGSTITLPDGHVVHAPTAQAARAVDAALSALGTPYSWGGTTPGVGLDCSGLTQWAYQQAGVDLPRVAIDQRVGSAVSTPLPGDLAVWDGHVALVIGNGQMIEAGNPVGVSPLRTTNSGMGFHGFFRPTA